MMIQSESDLLKIIEQDDWMMEILTIARQLDLPDWWICAGFIRSKIWDVQHQYITRTPISDIDVVYYNPIQTDESQEKVFEKQLNIMLPNIPWSVKNQARMHVINHVSPYTSSVDGISKFPETATCLGVKLLKNNRLVLAAPWGIQDAVNLEVRPTPSFNENKKLRNIYENRLASKKWESVWPQLSIF